MNVTRVYPTSGLLSPVWLAALVVLVVNDHALKQWAPGVVTGKLSDFAGMIVAPVLLACVLAVRSRGGLVACHVAVGVVFGSLKLSVAVAGWWPWVVVVDPTDLVALPMLWASWRGLLPAMRTPPGPVMRMGLASVAAGFGLLACVATSPKRTPYTPNRELVPVATDAVTVVMRTRVQGQLELRCDDGVRIARTLNGEGYLVISPLPAAGAECKLQLLGVPGSFGPVRDTTRLVECDVRPDSFTCAPSSR